MTLLLATFALVFLRAIQQQNVIGGHYVLATLTSYLMAVADVSCVILVVHTGWAAIPWVGTGGALGVTAAMWVHRRFAKKKSAAPAPETPPARGIPPRLPPREVNDSVIPFPWKGPKP